MKPKRRGSKDTTRDDVISRARYGQITPEEAEAEAKAYGWEPFASEPPLPDFDPMQESRWSMVMTVAWIAWRDLTLVRQQSREFRAESTVWVYREWNEAVGGDSFRLQKGWFLESWSQPTTMWLSLSEKQLARRGELPPTAQMSVGEAERVLWHALSEGEITAEALDAEGKPVDIPQREWSFLELYEEGRRDVLKYDALDRTPPYTETRFKRSDLFRLWPAISLYRPGPVDSGRLIDPIMFEPLTKTGGAGYVPLCAALHWIMTRRGSRSVAIDDEQQWEWAKDQLLSLIQTGEIEFIGITCRSHQSEKIPGHTLSLVNVVAPSSTSGSPYGLDGPPIIDCTSFIGRNEWEHNSNDKLFLPHQPAAAWSHLQVKKSEILARWPRPESHTVPEKQCLQWLLEEIEASGGRKHQSKRAYWAEAQAKFPGLKFAQFKRSWEHAVLQSGASTWSKSGRRPGKSNRSDG